MWYLTHITTKYTLMYKKLAKYINMINNGVFTNVLEYFEHKETQND